MYIGRGLKLTARGEAVLFAIVMTAAVIIGALMPNWNEWAGCDIVRQGDVTQTEWNLMMNNGWKGDATDSMEALHSPGCF